MYNEHIILALTLVFTTSKVQGITKRKAKIFTSDGQLTLQNAENKNISVNFIGESDFVFGDFSIKSLKNQVDEHSKQIKNIREELYCQENNSPCENGVCVNVQNEKGTSYKCICDREFTGRNCETKFYHQCESIRCRNQGVCQVVDEMPKCICSKDWFGKLCELKRPKECNFIYDEDQRAFVSPGYPNTYPDNIECTWKIEVSKTKVIQLNILTVRLGDECRDSAELKISDPMFPSNDLQICNWIENGIFRSTSNIILITLKTGKHPFGNGFSLSYTSMENKECGGNLDDMSGYVEYKNQNKPGHCVWIIKNEFEESLSLKFTDVHLKNDKSIRNYITIEINDGEDTKIFTNVVNDDFNEKISAKEIHITAIMKNVIDVKPSFKFYYEILCGGDFQFHNSQTFIIHSPGYPGINKKRRDCVWNINANNNHLLIRFNDFQIGRHTACNHDSVSIYDDKNQQLLEKYCGVTLPLPVFVESDSMKVVFSADGNIHYKGFEAVIEEVFPGCGGVFSTMSGSFSSPSNTQIYPEKMKCSYIINSKSKDYLIQVQFQEINLSLKTKNSQICDQDYITFYDGSSTNNNVISYQESHHGRFCGAELPPTVVSTGQTIMIIYTKNGPVNNNDTSFFAQWKFVERPKGCNKLMASDSGYISSPTEKYLQNEECHYKIISNLGHFIQLTFEEFNLPESENCEDGYLKIYNDVDKQNEKFLVGTFCGRSLPPNITSQGNELLIVFKLGESLLSHQFKAKFIAGSNVCGGYFGESEIMGMIQMPQFHANKYRSNLECYWLIDGKEDNYIIGYLSHLKLQQSEQCAKNDVLQLFDGSSKSSLLISEFCGSEISRDFHHTTSNQMLVRFKTDDQIQDDGFSLHFFQVCGGIYKKRRSGMFTSPRQLRNCSYAFIGRSPDDVIVLKSLFFDVGEEKNGTCKYERVEIRGSVNGSMSLCGRHDNMTIKSVGKELTFIFHYFGKTKYAKYQFNYEIKGCTKDFFRSTGEIRTPGYPDEYYTNNLNCLWRIKVDEGKRVELRFSAIDLAADCNHDNVTVFNGDNLDRPILGKYCLQRSSFTLISSSHEVTILFQTDAIETASGFQINYKEIENGCGGTYKSHHGFIHSSNYPESYATNSYCEYHIQDESGHLLEIEFKDFDIEASEDCRLSYLEISDGSPNIPQRYCGSELPNKYISTTNQVQITFSSGSNNSNKKGFNLEYNRACGGTIDVPIDTHGFISSLHYPSYYDQVDCLWILKARMGERISLQFVALDTLCPNDTVEVYDSSNTALQKTIFCGNTLPKEIVSTMDKINIRFKTENYSHHTGFKVKYMTLNDKCGYSMNWYEGEISSPGYPNPTKNSGSCVWHIKTFAGSRINLSFLNFTIGNGDCNSNFIEIYNGNNTFSNLLMHACRMNTETLYLAKSNEVLIKYVYEDNGHNKFFRISYQADCNNVVLRSTNGIIESPNYPNYYPNSISCRYFIEGVDGASFEFTFEKFDLQESENCLNDFLYIFDEASMNDNKERKYCGSNPPPTFAISSNSIVIYFESDAFIRKAGYRIKYTSTITSCGSKLVATDFYQNLTSRNYPDLYDNNLKCSWDISTDDETSSIEIRIFDLSTESDEFHENRECLFDYLTLYDWNPNSGKQQIAQLCGQKGIGESFYGSNNLIVEFISDPYYSERGFMIGYRKVCGGTLTSTSGEIISPIKHENTPSNQHCRWLIKVTPGAIVKINFQYFNLENSSNCENSSAIIYDGATKESNVIGKFCGNDIPQTLTSSSFEVIIEFQARSEVEKNQFSLLYEEITAGCGGTKIISNHDVIGHISSPKYPSPYPNSALCEWKLEVPEHYVVELEFDVFNLTNSESCNTEYVEVRSEGNSASNLIGRYCASNLPGSKIFKSKGHEMYIKFKIEKLSNGLFSGFHATWKIGCGGHFYGFSGIIKSPKTDDSKYPTGLQCLYQIKIPERKQVHLLFQEFSLNGNIDHCDDNGDFLEIYEDDDDKTTKKIYCGSQIPSDYTASSNKLYLKFISSVNSSQNIGFRIKYDSVGYECGGNLFFSGIFESPFHPQLYPFNRKCEWLIESRTPDNVVSLKFKKFGIEESENCTQDYLAVYFSNKINASQPAHKFCGSHLPPVISSTSSFMTVVFYSNSNLKRGTGFQAQFSSEMFGVCGPSLIMNQLYGEIKSPNYPQFYPSSSYCTWHIQVRKQKAIEITIVNMEIEGDGCVYDFLQIYEGSSTDGVMLAELCDLYKHNGKKFVSMGESMFIVFMSDYSLEFRGFLLKWREINSDCNKEISAENGQIISPNYPNIYPSNASCEWLISSSDGSEIMVSINSLDLPISINCSDAFLTLTNGHSFNDPQLIQLCGNKITTSIFRTTQNKLKITFRSNSTNVKYAGFNITFKTQFEGCGGIFHNEGYITSPNYPNLVGEPLDCEYIIQVKYGEKVVVRFEDINITPSFRCMRDRIEIRNGGNVHSPIIATLCTNNYKATYESDSNEMHIRFVTHQQYERTRGFKIHFNSGCGGNITGLSGTIKTPNYPLMYPKNQQCVWNLKLPDYFSILVNELTIDFPPPISGVCSDYIELDLKSLEKVIVCGSVKLPPNYVVETNEVRAIFVSDDNHVNKSNGLPYTGTLITYQAVCGGEFSNKKEGTIRIPPEGEYHHQLDCEYVIRVTPGKRLRLHTKYFGIEHGGAACLFDYLEIRNGGDKNAPLFGRFCGSFSPPVFLANSNEIFLKFHTDDSSSSTGFVIAYSEETFLPCGGEFRQQTSGKIQSPNYPDQYPAPSTCGWSIQVEEGKRINLTFTHFSLPKQHVFFGNALDCDTYILIYASLYPDDRYRITPLPICGREIPRPIISLYNTMYVRFLASPFDAPGQRNFEGMFNTIEGECGKRLEVTAQKNILDYTSFTNNNTNCSFVFHAPENKQVFIQFELVRMPSRDKFGNCQKTRLVLSDGILTFFDEIHDICGNETYEFRSTHSVARLVYKNVDPRYIFRLSYKSVEGCNNTIENAQGGLITSPNHPLNYQKHSDCNYHVTAADKDAKITLFVESFNIELTENCFFDKLTIYDGDNEKAEELGVFCGDKIMRDIRPYFQTTGPSLYMRFQSDFSLTNKGFAITYVTSKQDCGGDVYGYKGALTTPNYPELYNSSYDCRWIIKATPDVNTITINVINFETEGEGSINCSEFDFLMISDVSHTYTFCGVQQIAKRDFQIPVTVRFYSNQINNAYRGFRLTYADKKL